MIDLAAIDDLARRLSNLVPPGMSQARDDLEQNIKATLQMSLRKLELVTREEFDVQRAVLLRTREKMDALERTVVYYQNKRATLLEELRRPTLRLTEEQKRRGGGEVDVYVACAQEVVDLADRFAAALGALEPSPW